MRVIGLGDTVYFARVNHDCGIYEVCELIVRTVYENCFVGVDQKSKMSHLLPYSECDVHVFDNRSDAARIVNEQEKYKKEFTIDKSEG